MTIARVTTTPPKEIIKPLTRPIISTGY